MNSDKSLYEQLGGERAVEEAVERFYRKVMADPLLQPFFAGVELERLKTMQRAFLCMVFGGPGSYGGRDMRRAHGHLVRQGVGDAHFDAVLNHLDTTLGELGVSAPLRDWARAIAGSTRKDVLNR